MNIDIHEDLSETLTTLATGQTVTEQEYVTMVIEAHLLSALKKSVSDSVNTQNVKDIKAIAVAVSAIAETQKTLEAPVVLDAPLNGKILAGMDTP